ncbi:hypothetical protein JF770_14865 [Mycobacterium intracellulare]|uniref:hypothetical protein n=1 Tax=Mycobacterium intracellulare TaxID=1767 RepID=UPI001CDA0D75|nr:hypothetical protein [Mycobacterium intracellulare]MCA2304847.1 hypothetical protein [Mycobacterium intracellulare]MCA2347122.1 hypothetical protein [Mycobacterium intracellulare]
MAAAAALVVTLGAAALAAIASMTPSNAPVTTVVVPRVPPAPSADQVAAARTKACEVWGITATAMDAATNAVAHAPANWNDPGTQEALANEARVILVESAYLRTELPADTPAAIRSGINDYLAASSDMENATTNRKGSLRNAAIGRANTAEDKVNAACR